MKRYQEQIDEWVQGYAEPYWPPLSQFARVAEEVGEIGRLLNHMYGSKPKKDTEAGQDLGEEIADTIFALMCLANAHRIDLDKEMQKVIDKARGRDAARFKKKEL